MADVLTEPIENYALSKKDQPKGQFSKVGIVGCGSTGQRLALAIAAKGVEVIFLEVNNEKVQEALKEFDEELTNKINRWGMTEGEKRAILSRVKGTLDYKEFKDCEIVIEAIMSKSKEFSKDNRKRVFKNIELNVSPDCLIATNSTTAIITEFAVELEHKERCISMHISTTAPEANIIEVVKGLYTSDETFEKAKCFAKLIGKKIIPVLESPGLITVRLIAPLINEACTILNENLAKLEDIDLAMKNGLGMAMGAFEMADKIGLDRVVRWLDYLYTEFGDQKFKASPVLKRLVRGNHLGQKTLQGFYKYDKYGQKI